MLDAAEKHGWETAYSDGIEQSAYYDNIVSYCDLGYDMIYTPGNQYTDAVLQAAAEYPKVSFALQNGALSAGAISDLVPADIAEKYQGYLDQMVAETFMK